MKQRKMQNIKKKDLMVYNLSVDVEFGGLPDDSAC